MECIRRATIYIKFTHIKLQNTLALGEKLIQGMASKLHNILMYERD